MLDDIWYIYIDLQDLFFDIKLMWKESESWFTKGQLKGPTDWCWADEVHRQDHWHQHSWDLQRFQEWVPSLLDVWIIYDQVVFQSNWNLTWIKSLDLALQSLHHSLTCPATSGIKMTWVTAMMKPEPSALVWSGGPVVTVWAWSEPRT